MTQETGQQSGNSVSTIASTVIPYYGSREPKQSVAETDRIIFQMMDDIQAKDISCSMDIDEEEQQQEKQVVDKSKQSIFWRFRIILGCIIVLLFVLVTIVISEVSKKQS